MTTPTTAEDVSEQQIWDFVAAAQAGDKTAFAALYQHYRNVVFRFVLFRLGDRHVAEDLTSETFTRALRRISTVTNKDRDLGCWFITIARNLVIDHVKCSRYRLEVPAAAIQDADCNERGPEQQAIDADTATWLNQYVARLSADQRRCLELRFLQELSVSETAVVMDRETGAVKSLQHRAVRKLAELIPREAA